MLERSDTARPSPRRSSSIEIANTAAAALRRPSTMPAASVSEMASPSVVCSPELAFATDSEKTVVAPSLSSPVVVPAELTIGPAFDSKPDHSVDLVAVGREHRTDQQRCRQWDRVRIECIPQRASPLSPSPRSPPSGRRPGTRSGCRSRCSAWQRRHRRPSPSRPRSQVLPRLTASSYEAPGVGCSSDRYCATVTSPAGVDRDRKRNRPGRVRHSAGSVHPADDHAALVEQRDLPVVRRLQPGIGAVPACNRQRHDRRRALVVLARRRRRVDQVAFDSSPTGVPIGRQERIGSQRCRQCAAFGSSTSTPSDSSSTTLAPVATIAAVGPSSWNSISLPIAMFCVATSPSPSVTVTTAFTGAEIDRLVVRGRPSGARATDTARPSPRRSVVDRDRKHRVPRHSAAIRRSAALRQRDRVAPSSAARNRAVRNRQRHDRRRALVVLAGAAPVELTIGPAFTANPTVGRLVATPSNTVNGSAASLSSDQGRPASGRILVQPSRRAHRGRRWPRSPPSGRRPGRRSALPIAMLFVATSPSPSVTVTTALTACRD